MPGLMLRGLFKSDPKGNEFKQRIATAVEELRSTRQQEFGSSAFLIVIGEGDVPSFNTTDKMDADEFIVCFDGTDKNSIRAKFHGKLTALLNSIVLEAENVVAIRKVADTIVFFEKGSTSIYSFTLSGGMVSSYVSKPLTNDQIQPIGELYRLLSTDTAFQRVQHLIRSSFEIYDDSLRSFLAEWSAFEIFVNKVFDTYEASFFDSILEEEHAGVQRK